MDSETCQNAGLPRLPHTNYRPRARTEHQNEMTRSKLHILTLAKELISIPRTILPHAAADPNPFHGPAPADYFEIYKIPHPPAIV